MQPSNRRTLTQYLIEQRRRFPGASGELNALILDVALACKSIARAIAFGALGDPAQRPAAVDGVLLDDPGGEPRPLDVVSHEIFLRTTGWLGTLSGQSSERMDEVRQIPPEHPRGKYLLVFDPLDGSGNVDVNASLGSLFSILRAPEPGRDVTVQDFLQPGTQQVAAGYAIYGPATMLVLSVGNGVVGFTLDPNLGEFRLTHDDLRVPADTREFAVNTGNSRHWEPPVKRYVDECLAGRNGPRGRDFDMRWIASTVAETHRVLMRGGIFIMPRDARDPARPGALRLLHEANPIAFLVEQAGGRASTGRQPVLGVRPSALHQCIGLVFGSRSEVERIERYHRDTATRDPGTPLFAERSLFRD